MCDTQDIPVLYVIFPKRLASKLTPGQIAAQATHAGTMHALQFQHDPMFSEWAGDTGFGITLIGVMTDKQIRHLQVELGVVVDPYLSVEGEMHYNITTCYYAFERKGNFSCILEESGFNLLRGEYAIA